MKNPVSITFLVDLDELNRVIQSGGGFDIHARPLMVIKAKRREIIEQLLNDARRKIEEEGKSISAIYRELEVEVVIGWSLRNFSRRINK